jgi:7-keto-8-aminopelargonate synthetase-like enzyme
LELLEAHPHRVGRLAENAATLRGALAAEGLAVGDSSTQIVPVEVGNASPTMELCERVLERGVFAQGIRPPTVPEGRSRLRFTVMATHRAGELERAAKLVGAAARELGIVSAQAQASRTAVAA